MNKLYYINLLAFIVCLTVLVIEKLPTNRLMILSLLALANAVIFLKSLRKDIFLILVQSI